MNLAVVANTSCSAGLNFNESIESAPHVKVLIGSDLPNQITRALRLTTVLILKINNS